MIKLNVGAGAEGMSVHGIDCLPSACQMDIASPLQTHTANVGIVTHPEQSFPDTDALVTRLPGVALGIRTADCVPIIIHSPDIRAVAAIHAGWKGTAGNIVGNTIGIMAGLGADPGRMIAAFGPSICGDCYETGSDLAGIFHDAGLSEAVMTGAGTDPLGEKIFGDTCVRVNLPKANEIIMTRHGISPCNIHRCHICTRHSDGGWPSWRRSPGTDRRLFTIIRLLP